MTKDVGELSMKRRSIHICELSRGSDSNLLKLQPTASIRARFKRMFQKAIIVSRKHPATRFYLRSHAAIAFERKRHGRSPNWWVIHPCSRARFFWEIVMSFTFLYCFILIPYTSAFYMLNTESYHKEESALIPAYFICMIDICLNFVTGYASSNSYEIFLDPGLIASHYARGYFLIDLITSVPYSWLLQDYHTVPENENSNFATIAIELLPLFKLLRLHTLYMWLQQFMQVLRIGHIAQLIIWMTLLSLLIFHWAACFSYGFPFIVMHATKSRIQDAETWSSYLPATSDFVRYLYSFHSGLTGLCAVDSNILEESKARVKVSGGDRFVTCVLLIFGVVYQVYLISEFASMIVIILQLVELEKAPETKYQQLINNVKFYVRKKHIPRELEEKLLTYYEYRFQDRYFKENVIVGSLADHLKDEILLHNCRKLMDSVAIFWNLPKTLLSSIISALKPEIFLPNDLIYKCDDEGNCMYFVGKGTLAMLTYVGREICHLEDGAYFGEGCLVYPGFKRAVTIIALEECELFRLDRKDFKRLIPVNSELHQKLRKIVKDQISILLQIENDELQGATAGTVSNILIDNNYNREKDNSIDQEG